MKALILAGGGGTRLHPLTLRTPKCLLPIAGVPNIIHLINKLNEAGINEIYVSINNKQLKINDFLINKKVNIIIENQEEGKLGSVGGLNYAVGKVGSDDFIILGADNYINGLDLKEFSKSIKPSSATIALYELPHKYMVELFGVAELKNNIITSFQEKPRADEARSQLGSTLIYGLSKGWVDKKLPEYINENQNIDTIGSMWQYFCEKDTLHGFKFKGDWADIGTPRGYIELNNKVMSELKNSIIHENTVIKEGTEIKGKVIIEEGCIIGKNCVIGPNTHLMHDVTVGEGSIIKGSVIFDNAHIGQKSIINNSIIDGTTVIKNNVKINDFCVIGYKSVIEENSNLIKGSTVWPFLKASGIIDGNIVYNEDKEELENSKYWV
ncbi:MAG: NDP-sugar synthase [Candidatus Nanoarchaeia archaeon]